MAAPSVSYSFSNGTASDASQVNQNFTDIINALTDGSKDLSISALTCAGSATLNGTVTLGNASSDTITLTGSVTSHVNPSAHNTYDFGTVTTLGWRYFYFASSSATKTAKIQGPAISSDITLTLPPYTGTLRNVDAVAAKTANYTATASDDTISCDSSGGTFTVTLPTAASITGKVYTIKKTDSSTTVVTIGTTSSQTIDGVTSMTINQQYDFVRVQSTGSAWNIIGKSLKSPAFFAHKNSSTQTIANTTPTQLTFGSERYDSHGYFATNAWTPLMAGKVSLKLNVTINSSVDTAILRVMIYKNGSVLVQNDFHMSTTKSMSGTISIEDETNGSTDVFTAWVYQDTGSAQDISGSIQSTNFSGHLVQ